MPSFVVLLGVGSTTSTPVVVDHSLTAFAWVTASVIFVLGVVTGRLLKSLLARTIRRGDAENAVADVVGRMVGFVVVVGFGVGLKFSSFICCRSF